MRVRLVEDRDTDSQGNVLSSEQIAFFKNSKVRDNKGRLLVCYHGTSNPGFKEFNPKDNKSQFGEYKFNNVNVNYFTTNIDSASSYTDMGYENNGNVYYCYLNIENPYIVNNESLAEIKSSFNIKDSNLRRKQTNVLSDIYNMYIRFAEDEDDIDIDDLNDWFKYLNCRWVQNGDYFDLMRLGNNSAFGNKSSIFYVEDFMELQDEDTWEELEQEILGDVDDYYLVTDDVVKLVLYINRTEGTNYDGIIIDDIVDSKSMFSSYGTDIITLKSSNQIKSVDNTNPTNSDRIDESFNLPNQRPNTIRLYHNTPYRNIESILKNGFKIESSVSEKPSGWQMTWFSTIPYNKTNHNISDYGGNTVIVDLPMNSDIHWEQVNSTQVIVYDDIPAKYIVGVDYLLAQNTKSSELEYYIERCGKDKVKDVLIKHHSPQITEEDLIRLTPELDW